MGQELSALRTQTQDVLAMKEELVTLREEMARFRPAIQWVKKRSFEYCQRCWVLFNVCHNSEKECRYHSGKFTVSSTMRQARLHQAKSWESRVWHLLETTVPVNISELDHLLDALRVAQESSVAAGNLPEAWECCNALSVSAVGCTLGAHKPSEEPPAFLKRMAQYRDPSKESS